MWWKWVYPLSRLTDSFYTLAHLVSRLYGNSLSPWHNKSCLHVVSAKRITLLKGCSALKTHLQHMLPFLMKAENIYLSFSIMLRKHYSLFLFWKAVKNDLYLYEMYLHILLVYHLPRSCHFPDYIFLKGCLAVTCLCTYHWHHDQNRKKTTREKVRQCLWITVLLSVSLL